MARLALWPLGVSIDGRNSELRSSMCIPTWRYDSEGRVPDSESPVFLSDMLWCWSKASIHALPILAAVGRPSSPPKAGDSRALWFFHLDLTHSIFKSDPVTWGLSTCEQWLMWNIYIPAFIIDVKRWIKSQHSWQWHILPVGFSYLDILFQFFQEYLFVVVININLLALINEVIIL